MRSNDCIRSCIQHLGLHVLTNRWQQFCVLLCNLSGSPIGQVQVSFLLSVLSVPSMPSMPSVCFRCQLASACKAHELAYSVHGIGCQQISAVKSRFAKAYKENELCKPWRKISPLLVQLVGWICEPADCSNCTTPNQPTQASKQANLLR